MNCHSQQTTNALLHPPAAKAKPRALSHRNRQTLPGEVWMDGSREAPCCRSNSGIRPGKQAEEHVSEWQRVLHLSLDIGLEEVPEWHGAWLGQGGLFRGSQAKHRRLLYLTGLERGHSINMLKWKRKAEERKIKGVKKYLKTGKQ